MISLILTKEAYGSMDEKFREILIDLSTKLNLINENEVSLSGKIKLNECRDLCAKLQSITLGSEKETKPSNVEKPKKKLNKILIIDDSEDILRLLKFILPKHNFEVFAEEHPVAALKKIPEISPDIILLDLMMTEMSGFEILNRIRHCGDPKYENLTIVIGSSRTYEQDKLNAFNAGANDFVSKPYNINELVHKLQKLCS